MVDVPCIIEEGVDAIARIVREGDPENGESLFVEAGNPLRIQHESKFVQTLALKLQGTIHLLLTVHPDSNSTRLVRPASFTVHLRVGADDPPATKDSVAPQLCVQRGIVPFVLAAFRAANSVIKGAIGLLTVTAGGSAAILLALGETTYAILPAAVVGVVLAILVTFILMSWVRRNSEVTKCRTN